MNKRAYRDTVRFIKSLLFSFLYFPHILLFMGNKIISNGGGYSNLIISDLYRMKNQINISLGKYGLLLYFLHNSSYFRTLFYHRVGPISAACLSWFRPGDPYFSISYTTSVGIGFCFFHPFSTVINAQSIGNNFTCLQCTTIGATSKGRPVIGDNVTLGANVTIIGKINIGHNVTVGAGAVVVKDLPDNCVAVGNPAKVIKYKSLLA